MLNREGVTVTTAVVGDIQETSEETNDVVNDVIDVVTDSLDIGGNNTAVSEDE